MPITPISAEDCFLGQFDSLNANSAPV